jgi:hypothetical protein
MALGVDQDVRGLEVAVHHARVVGHLQGVQHVAGHAQGLAPGQRAARRRSASEPPGTHSKTM